MLKVQKTRKWRKKKILSYWTEWNVHLNKQHMINRWLHVSILGTIKTDKLFEWFLIFTAAGNFIFCFIVNMRNLRSTISETYDSNWLNEKLYEKKLSTKLFWFYTKLLFHSHRIFCWVNDNYKNLHYLTIWYNKTMSPKKIHTLSFFNYQKEKKVEKTCPWEIHQIKNIWHSIACGCKNGHKT